jgi:flagellar FliL protein
MSKAPAAPAKPEVEAAPTGGGGGGKSKLVIILISVLVVLLIAGGGAAAWFFTHQSSGKAVASKKVADDEDAGKPPVFLPLDPFTINLVPDANSGDSEKYLQVAITIQVSNDKAVDNFKLHMPLIRSRILLLLAAQKASVLLTEDGKNALIKAIEAQLTQPFDPNGQKQKVRGVFFTSFIIQ